jgi:hypothetical protein
MVIPRWQDIISISISVDYLYTPWRPIMIMLLKQDATIMSNKLYWNCLIMRHSMYILSIMHFMYDWNVLWHLQDWDYVNNLCIL